MTTLSEIRAKLAAKNVVQDNPQRAVISKLAGTVQISRTHSLSCACGCPYLHQTAVSIFYRLDGEEDAAVKTFTVDSLTGVVCETPTNLENPSERRQGTILHFRCEQCSGVVYMSLEQCKGETILGLKDTEIQIY